MITAPKPLYEKLKDRIRETCDAGLILQNHMNKLISAIDERTLKFQVPERVTARIWSRDDPNYGFDVFRCSKCGRLYSFRQAAEERLRCPRCAGGPRLTQAPIFGANYRDRPPVPVPFSEVMEKVTSDWNSRYCVYQNRNLPGGARIPKEFIKGLMEADRRRPIESLCWTCPIPDVPCEFRDDGGFCTYSRYARGERSWRPDLHRATKRIRLVAPQVTRRTPFGIFFDRYRPITISEGSTKPIRIAIHSFRPADATPLSFHQDELPGISEILHVSHLEILQFVIALAVGLPYIPVRRRPIRLLTEKSVDGEDVPYFLSRMLITEGIVLRLKPNVVHSTVSEWMGRRPGLTEEALSTVLYHTVSHAFLKPLPMIAGLDATEFAESFSAPDNEVAIFDNSPGGIGGVKTVVEDGPRGAQLDGDYVAQLLNSMSCQLECSWACKACLHLANCGWINRQLRREMLVAVINERLRTRYFGS